MEKVKDFLLGTVGIVFGIISVAFYLFVAFAIIKIGIAGWQTLTSEPSNSSYTQQKVEGYNREFRRDFMAACTEGDSQWETYCACMYADVTDNYTYREVESMTADEIYNIMLPFVDGCLELSESSQWR